MWIADKWNDFELIDCSDGEKLERWGQYYLVRPDPQAIWLTPRTNKYWVSSNARYHRSETGGRSLRCGSGSRRRGVSAFAFHLVPG